MQHNTQSGHTSGQEPSIPGHHTRNNTHRASTTVIRSQGAQDTVHAIQLTELTYW